MFPFVTLVQVVVGAFVTRTVVKEGTGLYHGHQMHQEALAQEKLKTRILAKNLKNMKGEELTEIEVEGLLDPTIEDGKASGISKLLGNLKDGVKAAVDV